MRFASISLAANTLGSVALFLLFRRLGWMPHLGIAVATTLGGWLNAGLLYATLAKRAEFVADARLKRALPRILLASALMGLVLWILAGLLAPQLAAASGLLTRAAALATLVGAGFIVYSTAALALGIVGLRQLRGQLRRSRPAGSA